MNGRAYYNENDKFASAWLRECIAAGLVCPGDVDERSIEDVRPSDLAGYSQHHWFAGIGIWSRALREAGWSDDRAIWTGSCPCQPFSAAGKGSGFADERHLWPAFFHLIRECRPERIFGEQVASKDGLAWLDLVSADLEGEDYAIGAVDTCAAGFGAPHIRQRLYFAAERLADASHELDNGSRGTRARRRLEHSDGRAIGGLADANDTGSQGRRQSERKRADQCVAGPNGMARRLADADERQRGRLADGEGCERNGPQAGRIEGNGIAQSGDDARGLADADDAGSQEQRRDGRISQGTMDAPAREGIERGSASACRLADADGGHAGTEGLQRSGQFRREPQDGVSLRSGDSGSEHRSRSELDGPGPVNGLWRDADWLFCRDGKWRPVMPETFPLADVGTYRNRVGTLRGAGNSINLAQAIAFIEAYGV